MLWGRIRLACVLVALLAGASASAARAASVTDLGDFVPSGINEGNVVVGNVVLEPTPDTSEHHAAMWSDGVLVRLPERLDATQSDAFAVSETGRIVGDDDQTLINKLESHAVIWNGLSGPIQISPLAPPLGEDFSQAVDVSASGDVVGDITNLGPHSRTGFYAPGAGPLQTVGLGNLDADKGSSTVGAISADGKTMLGQIAGTTSSDGFYLWQTANPSAPGTKLDLTPPTSGFGLLGGGASGSPLMHNDLASDGAVLGYKGTPGDKTFFVRSTDGTETQVSGLTAANAINGKHTVVGTVATGNANDPVHAVMWDAATQKVTDLNSVLPAGSGWLLWDALAINDKGDIVGTATHNGRAAAFLLHLGEDEHKVRGSALRGTDGLTVGKPPKPARGVQVTVSGTSSSGKPVSTSATTGTDGSYSVDVPAGSYTVTLPTGNCVRGVKGCAGTAAADARNGDVTVDIVSVISDLVVSVTLNPKRVTLEHVPETTNGKAGKTVKVTVKVKNTGPVAVKDVRLLDKLLLAYADGNAEVPVLPLKQNGKPDPGTKLGDLGVGKTSKPVTFKLLAKGDGSYSVQAIATGSQANGVKLRAQGAATLNVGSPLLSFDAKRGRNTHPQVLTAAGTAYTIKVTLKNLSYRKTLVVWPVRPKLIGNAQGARIIPTGADIPDPDAPAETACSPGQAIQLGPRDKKQYEIVVYTLASDAAFHGSSRGGTRSTAEFGDPLALVATKDGNDVERTVKGSEIDTSDGSSKIDTSLSDRGGRPEPFSAYKALVGGLYFTAGLGQAIPRFAVGTVSAVLGLPGVVYKTVKSLPVVYHQYIAYESEMWRELRVDPALAQSVLYLPLQRQMLLLAYKAPALAKQVESMAKLADGAVASHLEKLSNAWYAGDWKQAALEVGRESGELGLTVAGGALVKYLAPSMGACLVARSRPLIQALGEAKTALAVRIGEEIDRTFPSILRAFDASAAKKLLVPGMQLSYEQLRRIYGMTKQQVDYLSAFAAQHKVVIVVRDRGSTALAWIRKYGAVLKPEQIKVKTVSWVDVKYLGYRAEDIGAIALRDPGTLAQVEARLATRGVRKGTSEYEAAVKRWQDRRGEFFHEAKGDGTGGYYKDLADAAKKGEMRLRWNLADNSVSPEVATNSYTTYKFRLRRDGDFQLPEFLVDGKWRRVTGDIDFLSMMKADGTPLVDAARVRLYKILAENSPFGMLHPAADTWTNVAENLFSFPIKLNEFLRAGISPQFAPDKVVRAVLYDANASHFTSPTNYKITYTGGYAHQ